MKRSRPSPRPGCPETAIRRRFFVGTIVLLLVLSGFAASAVRPRPTVAKTAPVALYVSGSLVANQGDQLTPLDPESLADLKGGAGLRMPSPVWAISADGSTLVTVDDAGSGAPNPAEVAINVRDPRSGAVRVHVTPPVAVVAPLLSADGRRLLVMTPMAGSPAGVTIPDWYAYDAMSGDRLATIDGATLGSGTLPIHEAVTDSALRHLYRLIVPAERAAKGVGPWPVQLIANDLTTGAEIGRLDLPEVQADDEVDRVVNQVPIMAERVPGLAVSPDGRTVAIVHADADKVTLIDAAHLTVTRTVAFARPTELLHRLLALLPLVPQTAAAKGLDGTFRQAVFAPDGRHLYVFGGSGTMAADGTTAEHGLGLELVDLQRGTIDAEGLSREWIANVFPTPDRQSVYVLGSGLDDASAGTLRRLDATDLKTAAERRFDGYREVLLLPARIPG